MPLTIDDLKDRLNPANDALERLIALNPPVDPVTGLSMRQGTPAAAAYRLALDETLARFGSVKAFREALGEDAERLAPTEADVGLAGTPVSLDFFPAPPIPKRKPEIRRPDAGIPFPDIGAPETDQRITVDGLKARLAGVDDPVSLESLRDRLATSSDPTSLESLRNRLAPAARPGEPSLTRSALNAIVQGAAGGVAAFPETLGIERQVAAQGMLEQFDKIDRGQLPDPVYRTPPSLAMFYLTADAETRQRLKAETAQQIRPIAEEPAFELGQRIRESTAEAFPVAPQFESAFPVQLGRGVGSTATFLVTGLLGRVAKLPTFGVVAGTGAIVNSAETFRDALANGASFQKAVKASRLSAVAGLSEAAPIARLFNRYDKATGGKLRQAIINTVIGGAEEGLQELFTNTAQNLIASKLVAYDPERGLFQTAPEAGAVGFTVGALFNMIASMLGLKPRKSAVKFTERVIRESEGLPTAPGAPAERGEPFQRPEAPAVPELVSTAPLGLVPAIRFANPDGSTEIFTGRDHGEAYEKAVAASKEKGRTSIEISQQIGKSDTAGFLTADGKYVTRKEAGEIAVAAGAITTGKAPEVVKRSGLTAEDIKPRPTGESPAAPDEPVVVRPGEGFSGRPIPPQSISEAPTGRAFVPSTPPEPPQGKPRKLSVFLQRLGGLNDVGGDVRAALGTNIMPGLINLNQKFKDITRVRQTSKKGLGLDDATSNAQQAGFFSGLGRPAEPDDLIDALRREQAGEILLHPDNELHIRFQEDSRAFGESEFLRERALDRRADLEAQARRLGFLPEVIDRLDVTDLAGAVSREIEIRATDETLERDREIIENEIDRQLEDDRDVIAAGEAIPFPPAAPIPPQPPEAAGAVGAPAPQVAGLDRDAGAGGAARRESGLTTEITPQGVQTVLPGAERITDREFAERRAETPLRAEGPQQGPPAGGLFDEDAQRQGDLVDLSRRAAQGLATGPDARTVATERRHGDTQAMRGPQTTPQPLMQGVPEGFVRARNWRRITVALGGKPRTVLVEEVTKPGARTRSFFVVDREGERKAKETKDTITEEMIVALPSDISKDVPLAQSKQFGTLEAFTPTQPIRGAETQGFEAGEKFKGFRKQVFDPDKHPLPKNVRPLTREEIIAPVLEDLGIPLFQGRVKGARLGFFRRNIEEVRIRNRSDLEVTAHELAHLLDKRFPEIRRQWKPARKANKAFRDELRAISYDKKKLFEGFAEFVRHWMSGTVDEASGRPFVEVAAPNFLRWFEGFLDGNRHGPAFRRAQQQMRAWFDQTALDRARSKIGQNENINQVTEARLRERFRAGALDDLFGVLNAEQTLTGEYNGPWYIKARLTRGSSGVVQGAVEFGAPVWSKGQVLFVDAEGVPVFAVEDGRVVRNAAAQPWGLEKALSLVADDLESFGQYAIGKRADFLRRQGRENLFSKAEIDAMLALETPSRAKAFENWNLFNKQLLDFAEQSGVIDPVGRAKWETNVYLPFWRVTSPSAGFLSTQRAGIPGFTGVIKRLKGGTGNVGDPIENMYRNTRMLIESAIFNDARANLVKEIMKVQGESPERPGGARFLARIPRDSKLVRARVQSVRDGIVDAFQKAQAERERQAIQKGDESPLEIGERLNARAKHFEETLDDIFAELPMGAIQVWEDNQPPQGPNVIAIMQGGKPQFFEVADPLLFSAFTSMPRAVRNSGVLRFFKFFRRLGQRTVTWSIDFATRNIVRDNIMATVMSESGFRPFMDAARGMRSRLAKDPAYQAWLANGGGLASFWSSERAFESRLRGHYENHGIAYNLVINTPKKFGFFLDALLDSFETGTRIGEFQRALKRGGTLQEAAFQSREISTDFAMRGDPRVDILVRGDAATLAALYDTVLFLKAGVVGVDRVYRGFTKQQNRGKVAVATGTIALASVFLAIHNRGNPCFDRLEDWDRDAHWHLFVPKAEHLETLLRTGKLPDLPCEELEWHFRWPKPWEIGGIATITERAIEGVIDQDPSQAGKILNVVREMFRYNIIPQAIQPIAEQVANRQFFFDRPIEPPSIEGLEPFARSTPFTSRTIRALGEATRGLPRALQVSPARTEALIRGYFNTWALYGLMLSDQMFFDDVPALRLDQYPGLRPFFRQEPSRGTKFQTMFYDMLREASEVRKTMRAMDRQFRPDIRDERAFTLENLEFGDLSGANKEIREVISQMARVRDIPDLAALQKYADTLGRTRSFGTPIGKLRLSRSWRDLPLLKRDLLNIWLERRNKLFESAVKGVRERRPERLKRLDQLKRQARGRALVQ